VRSSGLDRALPAYSVEKLPEAALDAGWLARVGRVGDGHDDTPASEIDREREARR